ncbi:uncharacterized protein CBL_02489 [Carabus blaptoides fortunei]
MKLLVLLFASTALVSALSKPFEPHHGLPPPPPADRQARPGYWGKMGIYQDHFDSGNKKTYKMRYVYNNQFHTFGGPMFFMVGTKGTIESGYVEGGLMFDMARAHGGAMLYVEHRYYGESFPVDDLSTNNLRLLTTEQAMADVVAFIGQLKQVPNYRDSKVVAVGGNMAIWMRATYPNEIYAAWSSSAPVLAKVHFSEYAEVVSQSLSACTDIIRNGVNEVQRLLQHNDGIQKVSRDFNICRTLDVTNFGDTSYFYKTIFDKFADEVQYSTTASLNALCNRLNNPLFASDYDRLVAFYRTTSPSECVEDYNNLVEFYKRTGLDTGNGTY